MLTSVPKFFLMILFGNESYLKRFADLSVSILPEPITGMEGDFSVESTRFGEKLPDMAVWGDRNKSNGKNEEKEIEPERQWCRQPA